MKTRLYVVVLVLALGVTAMSPQAQDLPIGDGRNAAFLDYIEEIKSLNPNLADFTHMRPGTLYELPNGTWEELTEFDTKGIWGREFQKAYRLGYEDFLEQQQTTTLPPPNPLPHDSMNRTLVSPSAIQLPVRETDCREEMARMLALTILSLVLLYFLYHLVMKPLNVWLTRREAERDQRAAEGRRVAEDDRRHEREVAQDPVTSGPPIVPGGIPPSEPERLSQHLHDQATAQYARMHKVGMEYVRPRITRVGPIEHGTIYGYGLIGYLDTQRPRHIMQPIPGYRARFRFPDGSEQYLMSLQGCMNPCYDGKGMTGFTFTPYPQNGTVAETPAPVPPIPTVGASATTASAEPPSVTPQPVTTTDRSHISFHAGEGSRPDMVSWSGNFTFHSMEQRPDGSHTIRFHRK
jgi:hypothetical protein